MRTLSVALVLAIAGSLTAAADKDEDKAKEATLAFLKALKAKDLDAVMKTVDVPYLMEDAKDPIAKTEELKDKMRTLLEKVKPEKIPDDVSKALDATAFRKLAQEKGRLKGIEMMEKAIGKTGFAMLLVKDGKERGLVLVRIKDGTAKVVGIAD
jgi:hypothetical protein